MSKYRLWGVALLLLATRSALATNGYFLQGYGTSQKAEAGVGIALPQDALTVATNPAGLAEIPGAVTFGVELFRPDRGATLVQGGQAADFDGNGTKNFYLPEIGVNGRITPRLAWGVALYGNGGLDTDYRSNPFARFGANGSAGVDLEQAFLSPALAFKINDANSVGVSLNIAYQRFKAKGIGLFAGFSSDPADVSDHGADTSTGLGVRLGWLGHIGDFVTVGATWQSKTHAGRFKDYAGLFAGHGSFDIPESYGVGIAVHPSTAWSIALDWQRILYSDVPAVGDPINSLFTGVPLGADNGPGFGWRDISVVKLGGSYAVSDAVTLRAGLSKSQQPIPSSQTFFNILAPGVIETHLTLGGSFKLSDRNTLHAALLHAFKHTVDGAGSIPPAFGGGEANIHLEENSLAISFSHGFE
jgi:long-chain fatty acid transport protein